MVGDAERLLFDATALILGDCAVLESPPLPGRRCNLPPDELPPTGRMMGLGLVLGADLELPLPLPPPLSFSVLSAFPLPAPPPPTAAMTGLFCAETGV